MKPETSEVISFIAIEQFEIAAFFFYIHFESTLSGSHRASIDRIGLLLAPLLNDQSRRV